MAADSQSQNVKIRKNYDLSELNSFRVPAMASAFVEIKSADKLSELVKSPKYKDFSERLILGSGSNTLFAKNYSGLVIKMSIPGCEITSETEKTATVRVGAGMNWNAFVQFCLDQNLGGAENLISIPGDCGAAPVQNIGAYGVELDSLTNRVQVCELNSGEISWLNAEDCGFTYRDSKFKREWKGKYAITAVEFTLQKGEHELETSYAGVVDGLKTRGVTPETASTRDVAAVIADIRAAKLPDPRQVGTAGSFFKNPIVSLLKFAELKRSYPEIPHYKISPKLIKIPAGWLIDQAGWKGKTFKGVHLDGTKFKYGVHLRHALVLVNYFGASGSQIAQLAEEIQASVNTKFEIELEPEVRIIK